MTAVHQVVPVLLHADAIGDEARAIRDGLRGRGFESEVFILPQDRRPDNLDGSARPIAELLDPVATGPPQAVLYHYAVASQATPMLCDSALPLVLIHHNVTPARWFHMIDPAHEASLAAAATDLPLLRDRTALALGDSEFTRRELDALGFAPTGVLPILLDQAPYREHRPGPLHGEIAAAPTLLTVGRVAPNKCIEDCIRLLAAYRAGVDPRARLWVAGDADRLPVYRDALLRLVARLGLQDAVRFLGRVTQQELIDCYRGATAYVSMSEHEGFGVPLLEAMVCELPILAFPSTAVPFTLGGAGLQVPVKDFPLMAEALGLLLGDPTALADHVDRGRRRAAELAPERTLDHLLAVLAPLLRS
ncbi:MAG TPA: glycosyltransferase [Candidatus Angelobacter sp.]|jgi:glycosyltransferase involved in cell wall biosynthesis|nr:glycosyltransferase [Candidatus Angelobacter sp.]